MKLLKLTKIERQELYDKLEGMPEFLAQTFGQLSAEEASVSPQKGYFSPVEQCWHLADLEAEAFAVRIRRLLNEENPLLPDFEGNRIAEERQYKKKSIADGIAAFQQARRNNITLLKNISPENWNRSGEQDGVGAVMLCDIPLMMAEHDLSHRSEIDEWLKAINS